MKRRNDGRVVWGEGGTLVSIAHGHGFASNPLQRVSDSSPLSGV